MGDTIILNRMYTGDYLDEASNLGHEIINLFQPDNEDFYYVYLMSDGTYPADQSKNIDAIYFTKSVSDDCVEVLSVATGISRVFDPPSEFRCFVGGGGKKELDHLFYDLLCTEKLKQYAEVLNMDCIIDNLSWLDTKTFAETKKNTLDYQIYQNKSKELLDIAKSIKGKRSSLPPKEIADLCKAIIRRAMHLHQMYYIAENKVCYGGVSIDKLFEENTSEQYGLAIYLTYKAESIKKPKQKVYLVTDSAKGNDANAIYIKIDRDRLATTTLATYFTSDGKTTKYDEIEYDSNGQKVKVFDERKGKFVTKRSKYSKEQLAEIKKKEINNFNALHELWKRDLFVKFENPYKPLVTNEEGFTFLSLIRKEYDELIYSNMFQFFFTHNSYRDLFISFIRKYTNGAINLDDEFILVRESEKNIDLLVKDSQNVVVIENKVKSAINGLKYDENGELIEDQLEKYRKYVELKYPTQNHYYFVFMPDYSAINTDELKGYTPIYYSELAEWFAKGIDRSEDDAIVIYYRDFVKSLRHHSSKTDNHHEEIMRKRLQANIDRLKLQS